MRLIEIPEQTAPDEIDEEILEIFVEEVGEVLENIVTCFLAWRKNPGDHQALKDLRRNFHTLKGSGRLVGATAIGELGWRFEYMLNQLLEGKLERSETMLKLIDQVEDVLPEMIEQFKENLPIPYEIVLLISQVDHFTQSGGQSLGEFDEDTTDEKTAPVQPPKKVVVPETKSLESDRTITEKAAEPKQEIELTEELELATDLEFSEEPVEELPEEELTEFDSSEELTEPEELSEFDTELSEIESSEELAELMTDSNEVFAKVEGIDPVLLGIFQKEALQHLTQLKIALHQCETNTPALLNQEVTRAFHTLNGSSRSVELTAISDIAAPLEGFARTLLERQLEVTPTMFALFREAVRLIETLLAGKAIDEEVRQTLLDNVQMSLESLPILPKLPPKSLEPAISISIPDASDEFMAIFLEEAEEILENTQSLLERWQTAPTNMQLMKELQRELHTLKGGARMVGIVPMGDLSHHLESVLTRIVEGTAQSSAKLQEVIQNSVDELAAMLEAVRSGVPLEMPSDLTNQINAIVSPGSEEAEPVVTIPIAPPKVEKVKAPTVTATEEAEPAATTKPAADKSIEKETDGEGGEDRIRVKVTLIDKLTNLAGELSISRAHMEQQQAAFKNNLTEMEQTVTRLRDQLRRLEIETEAQIISSFGNLRWPQLAKEKTPVTATVELSPIIEPKDQDEEFDPLELDRFSLLQQLSRSLMESVSDLLNIQDALKILTRQSDQLVVQQGRIGAELQEGIMRTRMVPFSRISPRLQRIARLTARELHKQIEFVINGENIEFERTVLNRVVAPLEHMLRNAIGHGIEDAETRQQAGKSTIAKVTIDLAREGSELIIKLSDDGAGLNLQAIRRKAEERQMIKRDTVISDQELMQFILEPSFSTASTITQVSGRGVGMDVVNTEVKQLGGSLQIRSKTGEGATFEIHLPLSLTINQALLVHVGEETMAIPLNHVDAVMRTHRQEVLPAEGQEDSARYYRYMDHDYRIFHLGELLGFGKISSIDSALIPTLFVRVSNRRLALLVDGIEGSKEVVVKSVGPQISTIPWIAGATILGDGRVVLILDVPTLTRADSTPTYATQTVEEITETKSVAPTIMVVDDSITVRKVTARLLKRQGMEVITAKDGVDAVAQLQEQVPDLMLLDVEMPRMDGYELATQVRNTPELKHIPIIMITSRTGAKHRDKAEKIGINRYLGKPFNENELLENINALLNEKSTPVH